MTGTEQARRPPAEAVSGLVLAGGAGRRVGGADKGLLLWRQRPLIDHVIERLAPQVDALIISANRNQQIYAERGWPIVADLPVSADAERYPGPLAGVAAGLGACRTPWLLTSPCDCPCLPGDLRARLQQAAVAAAANIAVARSSEGLQPTFLLCRQHLLASLQAFLVAGRRRLRDWCAEQGAIEVPFSNPEDFKNLNQLPQITSSAQ